MLPGDGIHLRPLPYPSAARQAPLDADAPVGRKAPVAAGPRLGFYDGVADQAQTWTTSGSLLMYPLDLVRASCVGAGMNFVSSIVALAVFVASGQVIYRPAWGTSLMMAPISGCCTPSAAGENSVRPVFQHPGSPWR